MTQKHIRATSVASARKKGGGKQTIVSKVNYIPGTKKGRMKTYNVTTHKKKK